MKLTVKKVGGKNAVGFVPANRAAEIEAAKLPFERLLRAEIVRPRSGKHNGLMFAFFTLVANVLNAGPGKKDWDQNSVRKRLLIVTGYADIYQLPASARALYGIPEGLPAVAFEPKSMAFDSMEQNEASRFFDRAVAYVLSEFGDWCRQHPDWTEVEAIGRKLELTGEAA